MPVQTPEQDINIKDLILDEPVRGSIERFDPQKELLPSDWQREKEILREDLHREGGWGMFFTELAWLKALNPQFVTEFFTEEGVPLDDYKAQATEVVNQTYNGSPRGDIYSTQDLLSAIFNYNYLFPESKVKLTLTPAQLAEEFDPTLWTNAGSQANTLVNLLFVNPQQAKECGALKGLHNKFSSQLQSKSASNDWIEHNNALRLAAKMRLLYPDEPLDKNLVNFLLEQGREYMQGCRDNPRQSAIVGVFDAALNLKILTTDRVTIEDGDYKFENFEGLDQAEPVPERRVF